MSQEMSASPLAARGIRHPRGDKAGRVARTVFSTRRGLIGASLVGIVVGVAVIGPMLAPQSPYTFVGQPFGAPRGGAVLGYDALGRDVLSRVLNGGWKLLLLAGSATIIGVGLGTVVGVTAGYSRRWTDGLLMRTADVVLAFPPLVFALMLVSIAGSSVGLVVLAVTLCHLPQVARVVRAAALEVCERDYVKAAELLGISRTRILTREVIPSVTSVIMVELGLRMTYSILIIAALSFIGFGLQPPTPSWGLMISENRIGITENPWSTLAPAALIAILTVGVNMLSDGVAQAVLGVEDALPVATAVGTEAVGGEPRPELP